MAKTYTAFTYDLTKSLKPIVDSCFEIPANLKVNIDITLDDDAYKQLASDPNWVQEVADTCHKAFTVTMDPMKAIFADEAKKLKIGGPKDQEAIDQITQRMAELLQGVADRLGTKAATSIVTMFDDYKKDKKAAEQVPDQMREENWVRLDNHWGCGRNRRGIARRPCTAGDRSNYQGRSGYRPSVRQISDSGPGCGTDGLRRNLCP